MEHQIFTQVETLPVIICNICRHGVWPNEVQRHLKNGAHPSVTHQDTVQISEAICQWTNLEHTPTKIDWPQQLEQPIPGLEIYTGGILCQRDSACRHVTRNIKTMREHWRKAHQWSQYPGRGRISRIEQERADSQLAQAYTLVSYQRIFPTRHGSQNIPIIRDEDLPPSNPDAIEQALQEVETAWTEAQAARKAQETIQACDIVDANPWLRMTGWTTYLEGIAPHDLTRSIATPETEENITAPDDPVERGVHRLWTTMERLVRKCQQTVQYSGSSIRFAAVQSNAGAAPPYQPLQAYMDADSIAKHVQPWQRILAFIARTQAPHEWTSPPYGMTPRQRKRWRQLWALATQPEPESEPESQDEGVETDPMVEWTMSPLEQRCLEFCIELLNQKQRGYEYESVLVCAMAVQGWSHDRWRDAESYPPILSRVIKVARFMVVQKALWLDPDPETIIQTWLRRASCTQWALASADDTLEDLAPDEGYDSADEETVHRPSIRALPPPSSPPTSSMRASSQEPQPLMASRIRRTGKSFQEQVEWMMQTFMVRGTAGPMQTLLDWRTYGLKIHYNTTAAGHITWHGSEEIGYQHLRFTIGDFRGFTHGLVGATRQILCDILGVRQAQEIPAIPWHAIYDDPTQQTVGWSFLKDGRTRWPVDGQRWIRDRVRAEPALQARLTVRRHRHQLHPPAVAQYFQQIARFKEKLAVLVQVSGGQPARAPELLSIQHINTTTNRQRNIYIEDGLVAVVSAYHKGFYASNDIKLIHRYLPQEVGELLVWYLWLVLPFVQQLEAWQTWQESPSDPPARPSHREDAFVWGPDPGTRRRWSSERLREVFKRETQMRLRAPVHLQAYREIAIGISRRFLRPSSAFAHNTQEAQEGTAAALDPDAEDGMDAEQWMGHIADLQAAHSSHLAGTVYAREILEQAGTTAHRRQLFRLSSTDWHRFLAFASAAHPSSAPAGTEPPRKRSPWEAEAEENQLARRHGLHVADPGQALRAMSGQAHATLRGVQGPAIRAIQDGLSPVVAVMPTGGGKSMLFMLPAFIAPGGTTIVVVPLVALRGDMMRRCQALGISCVTWESRRPPDEATIVLVTPESAVTEDFQTFVNRLRQTRRLDRIVIDECHTVLNEQRDFRPELRQLGRLDHARTQMVLLTATLPPRLEPALWQRMGYARGSVHLFRDRTSRPNVAYRVWQPAIPARTGSGWVTSATVLAFLAARIRQARDGKVIVYGSTIGQVVAVARALACEAFYSTQVDKGSILERFTTGQTRVITATSALGMGVDIPDIRSIIHLGMPRSLLDYGQESGRAGRDGQPSEAIIIQPTEGAHFAADISNDIPAADSAELVAQYMGITPGIGCRRYVLDQYLDETVDGYCRQHCQDSDVHEIRCDGCDPDWEASESIISTPPAPASMLIDSPVPEIAREPVPSPSASHSPAHSTTSGATLITQIGHSSPIRFPGFPARAIDGSPRPRSKRRRVASIERGSGPREPAPIDVTERQRQRVQTQRQAAPHLERQAAESRSWLAEERIEREVPPWRRRCYVCTIQGQEPSEHELYFCRNPRSARAQAWMQQVRAIRIQYAPYCACFRCGMPQSICRQWESGREDGRRTECVYKDILVPMMAMMLFGPWEAQIQPLWRQRLQQSGIDWQEPRQVVSFFGQATESAHGRHSQLFDIFCWLWGVCKELETAHGAHGIQQFLF